MRYVKLDTIQVDSILGGAARISSTFRAAVTGGTFRRSTDGLAVNAVDTVSISGTTIDLMANVGLDLGSQVDSGRVSNSIINAATIGVRVSNGAFRMDSTRVTNHLAQGLVITFGGGIRVRHSRFTGNGTGIRLEGGGSLPSFIHQSVIAGNLNRQGIRNDVGPSLPLDADSNFWGDALGPACASGCAPGSAGDSVLTADVSFANHLGATPPVPAPPAFSASRPAFEPVRARPEAVVQRPAASRVEDTRPPQSDRRRIPKSRAGQQRPPS